MTRRYVRAQAGEKLDRGDLVTTGADGKSYKAQGTDDEYIISPDFGDDPDGYISVNAVPGVGLAVAIGLFVGALVFAIFRYAA